MARELPVVEKLGPGLWSLPVPIPNNPLGYTLVYLLDSDRGPVLVDAGWHDPDSLAALEAGIDEAGFAMADVHGVLVTHHHPDHHGLAGVVRERSGAWIALHREDAEMVRRHREFLMGSRGDEWRDHVVEGLHAAGAPAEEVEELVALQSRMAIEPPAEPDHHLEDGQLLEVPGRRVRAVWTPGHSPGHTCFALEEEDRLLAGDHLLPTITPHVGLYEDQPDADPLGDYLASLQRIADLAPLEVLPAHQHRFEGAIDRVEEVRRHHADRLDEVRATLAARGQATLWELAEGMTWNRPWDEIPTMMRRVALSEAGAHLRVLERRGEAAVVGDTHPPRYRPAGA